MHPGWYRWQGADLLLEVRVRTNARSSAVTGLHGDAVRVLVNAPPSDNKANAALVAQLAEAFAVPLRHVTIEQGQTNRTKRLRITAPHLAPAWFTALGGLWHA